MPQPDRSRLARIKLLYAFAFGVLILTLVVVSAVMHLSIRQNVDDARIINLAGRQRMLSQRITKCALALAASEAPGSADPRAAELRLALAQWSRAHQGLQRGDPSLGLPAGSRSPAIRALFREMDGPHDAMLQAGGHLLASLDAPAGDPARRSAAVRQDARALLEHEGAFLALMDRTTFTFDREARTKVERLQRMESSVLFIGLVVLGLEFFLVFRPSISQLEVAIAALLHQEAELLAANQSLTTAERDLLQAQRAGRVATFRWDAVADHWTGSDLLVELLGLDPDGPRTFQAWTERLAPSRQAEFQDRFREFLASGTLLDLDYPVLDPATGTERWLHVQGQLERDAQRRPLRLSGTVQDITERRRAEAENRQTQAQLHQNQRLESLGSLAGGVAHDMNNVLAAVQAITEALRQSRPGDADLLRSLDALDAASVRGRGLVRGLTQFVRKELKETEILDLNRLVRDEADLLRRTTRQKVALVLDLETGLAPVLGERSTLATALMNICVNAVDAMPGGGILTLRTRSGEAGTVELEVSDTGEGMSPEVAERAMEPFFTTKPRGKGTGLGLATVHAAAVNHGGQAWLRSEPGKGTSVFLRFPACAGRPAPAPAPTEPLRAGRPLELLLVDDDFLVRDSLAALLTSLGHRVREAPGGAEALGALASGPPPDLVILDYNMPDMDGLETLRRLRRTLPRLPVLLATGFMEPAVQRVLDADPHASGISKPFTARELVRRMGGMLGA